MSDTVVAIVSAFFVIGIAVGIIAVVAMSVLGAGRRDHGDLPDREPPGPGSPAPEARWDDSVPGDRPHWPGEAGGDFSGT